MDFAIHQPSFIPWPGFFLKAQNAHLLILLDLVQFPRGFSWVNRNRIKGPQGEIWLTVPVLKKGRGLQAINEVKLLPEGKWRKKHLSTFEHCYKNAPYFDMLFEKISKTYGSSTMLADMNYELIALCNSIYQTGTKIIRQSDLGVRGTGMELLVNIAQAVDGKRFVSLSSAKRHIDQAVLARHHVEMKWIRYEPPIYPQLWGDFKKDLSILDLLFCYGPTAKDIVQRFNHPFVQAWEAKPS